nr:MAG TPA: hypothetical protein [Caudoviricetes sp.]
MPKSLHFCAEVTTFMCCFHYKSVLFCLLTY